ncbi:MAG: hypothetical protein E7812_05135 [Phenylobacterium sp.]|nr:MAG: hypothetical protein E7812_05135 [Phenylobacterium sp.]
MTANRITPPLAALIAGLALAAGVAHAAEYRAPRTAFGTPDLEGIWTNTAITMLQRPPLFKTLSATDKEATAFEAMFGKFLAANGVSSAPVDPKAPAPSVTKEVQNSDWVEMDLHMARVNGQVRTSWIVDPPDGRVPFTAAAKKARAIAAKAPEDFDGPEGRDTMERCLTAIGSPEGPPMMNTGFNANYQILQTPDHIAILVEMNHAVRTIRMRDRNHIPDAVQPWMGDSVGWWDGDTLVVETANLNPKGAHVYALGGGFNYSPKAHITERFTRTAKDQILYEFTIDDPATFTRPWSAQIPMRTAKGPIYEYACHEGNYALPNILAGARQEERAAAAAKATTTVAAK